jgi:hypothetical protein
MLVVAVIANVLAITRWGVIGCAAVTVAVSTTTALIHTTLALVAARKSVPGGPGEPPYLPLGDGRD